MTPVTVPTIVHGPFGDLIPNPVFNRRISKHAAARANRKPLKRRHRRHS